jgi:hypothetical protein
VEIELHFFVYLLAISITRCSILAKFLNKFDFVKVKQETTTSNYTVLNSLERSIKQMKDMRTGALPKPNISELFEKSLV